MKKQGDKPRKCIVNLDGYDETKKCFQYYVYNNRILKITIYTLYKTNK